MERSVRVMAERLHSLITSAVPALSPRTWYGMWPTCYALAKLAAADEARIVALVKQAVS
jgi:hypothetical protein